MIKITHSGSFKNTERFLSKVQQIKIREILSKGGERCVASLMANTPKKSGLTASKWSYKVFINKRSAHLTLFNDNEKDGVNIAVLIELGHRTRGGTFVQGRPFIDASVQSIFKEVADEVWKEVTTS